MSTAVQKNIILLVWILVIANLFLPTPEWLDQILKVIGIFLVVAHLIECVIFNKKIRRNHRPSIKGFLLVFIFGVVHLNTLPDYDS